MRRLLAGGGVLVVVALALAWFLTARGAASTGELDASVWVTHHRFEPLTSLSTFIDVAVQPICVYVLMGLAVLVFWIGGRGWDLVTEVILFLCAWGTTSLAKVIFQRQRPPAPPVDRVTTLHDFNSMPSGHTAAAAALTAALTLTAWYARGWVKAALALGIPLVLLVAVSRVVVGAHYVGDVTVAMLLSAGTSLLVVAALVRMGVIDPIQDAASKPLSAGARTSGS